MAKPYFKIVGWRGAGEERGSVECSHTHNLLAAAVACCAKYRARGAAVYVVKRDAGRPVEFTGRELRSLRIGEQYHAARR